MSDSIIMLEGTLNYRLRYANKLGNKKYLLISDYRISKCYRLNDPKIVRSIILYTFRLCLMKKQDVVFNFEDNSLFVEDIKSVIVEYNRLFDSCLRLKNVIL